MPKTIEHLTATILENPYKHQLRKFGDIYARGKEVADEQCYQAMERQPEPKFSNINHFNNLFN